MPTKDQADAASDALMQHPLEEQGSQTRRLQDGREKHRMPPIRWLIAGAILGTLLGGLAGYVFTGTPTAWSIVGLALGTSLGIMLDSRAEP